MQLPSIAVMLSGKLNKYKSDNYKTTNARHSFSKAIAFLATLQLSACVSNVKVQQERGFLTSTAEININVEGLIGQTVNVRNDVIGTVGARGLLLDDDRLLHGKSVLAIDLSPPLDLDLERTPEILITGTVSILDFDDIEAEYSLNLDRSLYANYEGKPVIVANSSILSPDPEDLNKNPAKHYGKQLVIQGEVEDIQDYGVFELDEESVFGGKDLLVVQTKSQIELNDEQNVLVFGVLKPLAIDELSRDYQLNWSQSTKQQIQAKYGKQPIFIAEKIQFLK